MTLKELNRFSQFYFFSIPTCSYENACHAISTNHLFKILQPHTLRIVTVLLMQILMKIYEKKISSIRYVYLSLNVCECLEVEPCKILYEC